MSIRVTRHGTPQGPRKWSRHCLCPECGESTYSYHSYSDYTESVYKFLCKRCGCGWELVQG